VFFFLFFMYHCDTLCLTPRYSVIQKSFSVTLCLTLCCTVFFFLFFMYHCDTLCLTPRYSVIQKSFSVTLCLTLCCTVFFLNFTLRDTVFNSALLCDTKIFQCNSVFDSVLHSVFFKFYSV